MGIHAYAGLKGVIHSPRAHSLVLYRRGEGSVDRNTRHIMRYWGFALLFGSLTVVGLIDAVLRGYYVVLCTVAAALVASFGLGWYHRSKLVGLLQYETAAPAVAYFKKNVSSVPFGRAISASLCALVLAMYGEFDEARDELSTISWNGVPPVYQGMRTQTLALLALLEERDYRKASELAAEMRDLVTVNAAVPGSKTSRRATGAFCDACALLAGMGTDEMVTKLEGVVGKLRPLDEVIIAWALTQYFQKVGNAEGVERYAARVRELAPHCAPLTQMDSV